MSSHVREVRPDDARALRGFFADMPSEDRTFFQHDVEAPEVIERWARDDGSIRRCVPDDAGGILALAALHPGTDWSSHVAELVLLVHPGGRRRGVGRDLARTMLLEAVRGGFKKVSVMIAADNSGAIDMFNKLGFQGEALLRDQLRNPADGELRDAVVLAHLVDEQWATMLSGGVEEAVA